MGAELNMADACCAQRAVLGPEGSSPIVAEPQCRLNENISRGKEALVPRTSKRRKEKKERKKAHHSAQRDSAAYARQANHMAKDQSAAASRRSNQRWNRDIFD